MQSGTVTSTSAIRSLEGSKPLANRVADYFQMSRAEFISAAALFAVMLVLKIINMSHFRFDSDESQHMHVIWAWARGFVQYRDVFDNHMPLFHIMFAPIFGLIGDRPTILYWMRFILFPMYLVAAWCTYQIGTRLFSRRVGIWAILLAGLYTGYHFTSFEFRADNLWAPLWLLCILVLIQGVMSVRRALIAGLIFGICFGVSMKSALLLLSVLVAAFVALLLVGRDRLRQPWWGLVRYAVSFLGASLLVPIAIMLFFAEKGVWSAFHYCIFEHNILPHLDQKNSPWWFILIFPITFPLVVCAARLIVHAAPDRRLAFRRAFVFLICGVYLPALYSFWNLITRQDFLPYHPLAFVFWSAAVIAVCEIEKTGWVRRVCSVPRPAYLASLGVILIVATRPFWINGAKIETDLLRDVLALTAPGDYVFDCTGETVFRQRCFRPFLEPVTLERIHRKMIMDDAALRCVETKTCLAAADERTPWSARQFFSRNYLHVKGLTCVVGGYLRQSSVQPGGFEFDSVIPASYKIVDRGGTVSGVLDGEPYSEARFLNPGKHFFTPSKQVGSLAFVWARAVDLHYSPFDYVPPQPPNKRWRW